MITDEMLLSLYTKASKSYSSKCRQLFEVSGFQKTLPEHNFSTTLHAALDELKWTKHVEVYPSPSRSKMIDPALKAVIGVHVPDFLLFGMKTKGYSAVVIEMDGDSHVDKSRKDFVYYKHLEELGVFVWSIPNNQARDFNYIKATLLKLRKRRSGSLDAQTRKVKRAVWVKTIANHMSLQEIEAHVHQQFEIRLNLTQEAQALLTLKSCPRNIRKELRSSLT